MGIGITASLKQNEQNNLIEEIRKASVQTKGSQENLEPVFGIFGRKVISTMQRPQAGLMMQGSKTTESKRKQTKGNFK